MTIFTNTKIQHPHAVKITHIQLTHNNYSRNHQQNCSNVSNHNYNRNHQQNPPLPQNVNSYKSPKIKSKSPQNRKFQSSTQNCNPHRNFKKEGNQRNSQQRNACENSRDLDAINVVADVYRSL